MTVVKAIFRVQHTKKNRCRKNVEKDEKVLYKLMNNGVYGKTMENLTNRTYVKFASRKKDYMKWTPK